MEIACTGELKRILWGESSGRLHGREYFSQLSSGEQAKFMATFERMCETGRVRNPEKFRKEKGDVWVFKNHQHRLYCFIDGSDFVITHGVRKKSNKVLRSELARTDRIRKEYLEAKERHK